MAHSSCGNHCFTEAPLWGTFNNGTMDPTRELFVQPGPHNSLEKGIIEQQKQDPAKPDP